MKPLNCQSPIAVIYTIKVGGIEATDIKRFETYEAAHYFISYMKEQHGSNFVNHECITDSQNG